MTKKTKSEVMTELEAAIDLINNGSHDKESLVLDDESNTEYILVKNKRGYIIGNGHSYTSDPYTRDQAFNKAVEAAKKFLFSPTGGSSPIIHNTDECFFQCAKEGEKHCYTKPVTNSITDEAPPDAPKWWMEAPPKGTPIVSATGNYFLSIGVFDGSGLLAMDVFDIVTIISTYKSLTTPHCSEDWKN